MKLRTLIRNALDLDLGLPDVEVAGVAQDSRRVEPGSLFVARRGSVTDGHRFVRAAAAAGAVALVGEAGDCDQLEGLPYIRVADARAATARLAATLFGRPSRQLMVAGVTGTDGKTTTAFLLHHLLSPSRPTGLLSTAAVRSCHRELDLEGHFTTPEAPEIQRLLATFRDEGCSHVVVEASSHGFAQRRLDEIAFDLGVWTNLSPEHLDFHGSLAAYREAKLELARRAQVMILNRDDPSYAAFAAASNRSRSYGEDPASDWRALEVTPEPGGFSFEVVGPQGRGATRLPLVGRYNLFNALAALAAAVEAGVPFGDALDHLPSFGGVPGRMQLVQAEPFGVVVDFAHTAPALERALTTLRETTRGRLIVVIGAAGERDPGKRAPLGLVAARGADLALFTEEDSRSEPVGAILEAMAAGAREAGGHEGEGFRLIPERRAAIGEALGEARPGDTVLLAGKGHERSLERAGETLAWDEVAEARAQLRGGSHAGH